MGNLTPGGAARLVRDIPRQLRARQLRAAEVTAGEVFFEALRLSSGSFSSKQLARMGHPYARRSGRGGRVRLVGDSAVINQQTGAFKSAWSIASAETNGGVWARVVNASREADFLDQGTKTMISRPVRQRLETFAKPRFEANLMRELGKGLA